MSPGEDTSLGDLEHRLARIEHLLGIGFAEQVGAKREEAGLDDPASAGILERSGSWIAAGELKQAVHEATGQSERTIKRRIQDLVGRGALEARGSGSRVEYRSSGRFG